MDTNQFIKRMQPENFELSKFESANGTIKMEEGSQLPSIFSMLSNFTDDYASIISADKWQIFQVDPAHVAMVILEIYPQRDSFQFSKPGIFNFDVRELYKIFCRKDNHLPLPSQINIFTKALEAFGEKQFITATDLILSFTRKCPDGIQHPHIPKLTDYPEYSISPYDFFRFLKMIDKNDTIRLIRKEKELIVEDRDSDDIDSVHIPVEVFSENGLDSQARTLYSAQYVKGFFGMIPAKFLKGSMHMGFKTDYPVYFSFTCPGFKILWLLSPRIENE